MHHLGLQELPDVEDLLRVVHPDQDLQGGQQGLPHSRLHPHTQHRPPVIDSTDPGQSQHRPRSVSHKHSTDPRSVSHKHSTDPQSVTHRHTAQTPGQSQHRPPVSYSTDPRSGTAQTPGQSQHRPQVSHSTDPRSVTAQTPGQSATHTAQTPGQFLSTCAYYFSQPQIRS